MHALEFLIDLEGKNLDLSIWSGRCVLQCKRIRKIAYLVLGGVGRATDSGRSYLKPAYA